MTRIQPKSALLAGIASSLLLLPAGGVAQDADSIPVTVTEVVA